MGEFSKEHNPETTIKRNPLDLSYSNNLTFNIGYIIPCFCKETLPGDTFSIDTLFALNFFPTYFPIQNKIRADVHFFYCRTRNIYNEFKRFQSNVSVSKPMPYLAMTEKQHAEMKPGSIYDYFNIPVTQILPAGSYAFQQNVGSSFLFSDGHGLSNNVMLIDGQRATYDNLSRLTESSVFEITDPAHVSFAGESNAKVVSWEHGTSMSPSVDVPVIVLYSFGLYPVDVLKHSLAGFSFKFGVIDKAPGINVPMLYVENSNLKLQDYYFFKGVYSASSVNTSDYTEIITFPSLSEIDDLVSKIKFDNPDASIYFGIMHLDVNAGNDMSGWIYTPTLPYGADVSYAFEQTVSLASRPLESNPFVKKPLNSSVFRCYESIYNSFFRDERNNPLLINGEPAYDEYLTSTDGGPDNFDYKLHRRNWEQDWFTTALPTPQQGNAPLVGISSLGEVTVSTEDGQVFTAQAEYAEDGDTITNVHYTPVNQDGTPMPNSVKRQLVSLATSGISINDFRNVNALQRYLETNIRRGLKFKDIMASRWGINISYAELNMPEFIGGVTEYVSPAQVNQTSQDTESSPLGSFAGQLFCKGQSRHSVRVFCDEPGYIIGLISVVPTPVYSQSLPKMFTKHSHLDFYNPEFGHIGLQPIPMLEVAPLQTPQSSLDETFGYQRAWYDYLASLDEVHGQFHTSLRDFVMYRTYDSKPVLSEDFLLVNNRDVDNVFSVQHDSEGNSVDKVIGQIHFSVKSRRPIPKYGIPRLE